MEKFLGMSQAEADEYGWRGTDEGGKLKETGTDHWTTPNTGATNASGFNALPGGTRYTGGAFSNLGNYAYFWTTNWGGPAFAGVRYVSYDKEQVYRHGSAPKDYGYSIRCIEGEGAVVTKPYLTSNSATLVNSTSAQLNGFVFGDGGTTVTDRGFYYGPSLDPVSTGTQVSEGSGTGSVSLMVSDLSPGETYYFVAYATNSAGTAYGNVVNFTTEEQVADIQFTNTPDSYVDSAALYDYLPEVTYTGTAPTFALVTGPPGTSVDEFTGELTYTPWSTGEFEFVLEATNNTGSVQLAWTITAIFLYDIDWNTYRTVQIGNQVWMAENLKTTKYANGNKIQHVIGNIQWNRLETYAKAYCWYDGDTVLGLFTYGGLYTWAGAMNGAVSSNTNPSNVQGACPDGWHLPSDAEWKEMEMFLGMSQADADSDGDRGSDEGGKLKEEGLVHWASNNEGATNESGFTALPAGYRGMDGFSENMSYGTNFWTATENESDFAWSRKLSYFKAKIYSAPSYEIYGYSIRCVMDLP